MSEPFIIHGGQVYLSAASIMEGSVQSAKVKCVPNQDVNEALARLVEVIRATDLGQELAGKSHEADKRAEQQLEEVWMEGAKRAYEAVSLELQSHLVIGASAYAVKRAETDNGIPYAAGFVVEGTFPKSEGERKMEQQEARIEALEAELAELKAAGQGPKLGMTIRSNDFVEGVSGWELHKNGLFRIFTPMGLVSLNL